MGRSRFWAFMSAICLLGSPVQAQVACDPSTRCACAGSSCTCSNSCQFECISGACDFVNDGGGKIACQNATTCVNDAKGSVNFACEDGANCRGKLGPASSARCFPAGHCQLTVGADSVTTCNGSAADCDVTCEASCVLLCSGATCVPKCNGTEPLTVCASGVKACGACPDAGVDGGQTDAGAPDAGADGGEPDAGAPAADAGPMSDAGRADAAFGTDAGAPEAGAFDGGDRSDAGVTEMRALGVGCGCSSAWSSLPLATAAYAVVRRGKRREGQRPTAEKKSPR